MSYPSVYFNVNIFPCPSSAAKNIRSVRIRIHTLLIFHIPVKAYFDDAQTPPQIAKSTCWIVPAVPSSFRYMPLLRIAPFRVLSKLSVRLKSVPTLPR